MCLGMVARVAGIPALSRGIEINIRSAVISKPVKTVFSGLEISQILVIFQCLV